MLGQHPAVHLGHHGVQQDQGERGSALRGPRHGRQSLRATIRQGRHHAPLGQDFLENAPVGGVIVHDKHGQPGQVDVRGTVRQKRRPDAHAGGEVEDAARAFLTFDPDAPAHQGDQACRDGQAQARPTVLTRGRAVRLGKRLKDLLLPVSGDADARIAHGEVEEDRLFGPALHLDGHHDFAGLGELDGVAGQVH